MPEALLPLSDTYQLLSTYVPPGLAPYQPEQIVLRIEEIDYDLLDEETKQVVTRPATGPASAWPLPDRADGLNSIAVDAARQRVYVGGTDTYLYVFDWQGAYLGREEVDDSQGVKVQVGPGGRVYRSGGYNHIQIYEPTS